ncbi:hypothetical protein GCM10022225_49510 [Plantactinospora mayteni]|uniref:GNAT family N-acetyltransferase n=1 Tax=Plantactinospora mayteni TaxID=566021 RepID=A0ABQ4EXR6_9ACTN|nr:GNAT family N-acetyltransferase [Plantactinospora mayteni]GIG99449.1 hypothetical protein Pma05_60220 [Plantactinospora mayteni]
MSRDLGASHDPGQLAAARLTATRAATRAGVRVRPLVSLADTVACERLLEEVWRSPAGHLPLAADVIRSLVDAGSLVAGAFETADPGRLVGACIGFWSPPGRLGLYSHIAGVRESVRGRDIGFALKLDQRAGALEQGATEISWTFDPLVARNAHFNLHKLGGGSHTYLVDHYGRMTDGLNGDDPTDRLMLRWELLAERVRRACDEGLPPDPGPPPPAMLAAEGDRPRHRAVDADRVLVAVPPNIEELRRRDPATARAWRSALRDVLGALLDAGARLVDFDRTAGGYVVDRGERG